MKLTFRALALRQSEENIYWMKSALQFNKLMENVAGPEGAVYCDWALCDMLAWPNRRTEQISHCISRFCPATFCFTLILVISVKVTQMRNFDGTVSEILTFHGTFAINNILWTVDKDLKHASCVTNLVLWQLHNAILHRQKRNQSSTLSTFR